MQRLARVLTEVFSPTVVVSAFLLTTGAVSDGWRGLWFGLLAAFFTAVGPFAGVVLATRLGKVSDHHVGNRRQRLPILLGAMVSGFCGLVLLLLLGAPRVSIVGLLSVIFGMVIVGAVNAFWKLSVHVSVVTFAAVASVLTLGSGFLPALLIPAAVGWSRVKLSDHSTAQVLVGIPAGCIVAAAYAGFL
ncbi:phosphatidic acid phosphatase [Paeniglutamicibacter antarcticus]|uniref:Phosphatidic acid phosphatase n=1 Tax=Arthrobacter terrae TaxID=2935737 RepID=A0A931CTM8_9MICC|nr:phosphatidic acid phosphatase [Arthrobacter terrae]MBG0740709.1 phosphatidic acid phosphatase [Arthrobacter terrae]